MYDIIAFMLMFSLLSPKNNSFKYPKTMFIIMWIVATFSGIGCWNCCKYVYNNVHVTFGNK